MTYKAHGVIIRVQTKEGGGGQRVAPKNQNYKGGKQMFYNLRTSYNEKENSFTRARFEILETIPDGAENVERFRLDPDERQEGIENYTFFTATKDGEKIRYGIENRVLFKIDAEKNPELKIEKSGNYWMLSIAGWDCGNYGSPAEIMEELEGKTWGKIVDMGADMQYFC